MLYNAEPGQHWRQESTSEQLPSPRVLLSIEDGFPVTLCTGDDATASPPVASLAEALEAGDDRAGDAVFTSVPLDAVAVGPG